MANTGKGQKVAWWVKGCIWAVAARPMTRQVRARPIMSTMPG